MSHDDENVSQTSIINWILRIRNRLAFKCIKTSHSHFNFFNLQTLIKTLTSIFSLKTLPPPNCHRTQISLASCKTRVNQNSIRTLNINASLWAYGTRVDWADFSFLCLAWALNFPASAILFQEARKKRKREIEVSWFRLHRRSRERREMLMLYVSAELQDEQQRAKLHKTSLRSAPECT